MISIDDFNEVKDCTGVSTNGNIGWVDSRNRTFKEVFPKQK